MRIEKLEGNKIRVTLFAEDLDDYHVNVKMLRPDSPQLHTFLFEIMERVKHETGFNPYSGQIVVEATPSGDGIVLVVTKISEEKTAGMKIKAGAKVRAVKKAPPEKQIYAFAQFEDACTALMHVHADILEKSSFYAVEGYFYLVCAVKNAGVLAEFANLAGKGTITEAFLQEHGTRIAAGGDLVEMAEKIKNLN